MAFLCFRSIWSAKFLREAGEVGLLLLHHLFGVAQVLPELGVVERGEAVALLHHGADIGDIDQRAGIGRHRVEDMAAAADQDAGSRSPRWGACRRCSSRSPRRRGAAMAMTAVQPIGEVMRHELVELLRRGQALERNLAKDPFVRGRHLPPALALTQCRSSRLEMSFKSFQGLGNLRAVPTLNKPQTSDLAKSNPFGSRRQCETFHNFLPESGHSVQDERDRGPMRRS